MRSEQQVTAIVTQAMKNLHTEYARKWGFQPNALAGATFGLGITMLIECGYSEAEILESVRQVVADLTGSARPPGAA